MKVGKQTAKLLREAMVLGHVEGAWWAGGTNRDDYPADSDVVARILHAAKANRDLYPTLSKVEVSKP